MGEGVAKFLAVCAMLVSLGHGLGWFQPGSAPPLGVIRCALSHHR
jgi:hypothetical protein